MTSTTRTSPDCVPLARAQRAGEPDDRESRHDARRYLEVPGPFHMHRGGELPQITIAYETWGELTPRHDNAILLYTGLSPSAHAACSARDPSPGWWEFMIGPDKPIDTNHFFVVCVNSLGSCFGSTGPASTDPRTGKPYRLSFPELAVEDIARAGRATVKALGIDRLHTVMGASLGGMAATAYAIEYADDVENVALISSAAHASPAAIAIRSLQREIIRSDPMWRGGYYDEGRGPVEGMRIARKLGLMSYRSADEWRHRFGRDKVRNRDLADAFSIEFQIESYLDANARKFTPVFDANCYLYLSRAMDWFDVADHGGSIEVGLARMRAARILILGVDSDSLFPAYQQEELTNILRSHGRDVSYVSLPSIEGHDSFLVDKERFGPPIKEFLEQVMIATTRTTSTG